MQRSRGGDAAPAVAGGRTGVRFQYIALEGPIGVGKTSIARRLAQRFSAHLTLEEWETNPFLGAFYDGAPGAAFQVELFFLLSRYRQQQDLLQRRLFEATTIADYTFEKSKLFANLNLDDSELLIFDKLYGLLAPGLPHPDLVVYLQAPVEVLSRRLRGSDRSDNKDISDEYLSELLRAYNYYFFHYALTPLLVVNTAEVDFVHSDADLDDLVRQIHGMTRGTQYYVPRGSST